jgi:hypothetical protein
MDSFTPAVMRGQDRITSCDDQLTMQQKERPKPRQWQWHLPKEDGRQSRLAQSTDDAAKQQHMTAMMTTAKITATMTTMADNRPSDSSNSKKVHDGAGNTHVIANDRLLRRGRATAAPAHPFELQPELLEHLLWRLLTSWGRGRGRSRSRGRWLRLRRHRRRTFAWRWLRHGGLRRAPCGLRRVRCDTMPAFKLLVEDTGRCETRELLGEVWFVAVLRGVEHRDQERSLQVLTQGLVVVKLGGTPGWGVEWGWGVDQRRRRTKRTDAMHQPNATYMESGNGHRLGIHLVVQKGKRVWRGST